MTTQTSQGPRFIRKTALGSNENNTNFVMLDNDIADAVSSAEADKVTPLMSKIYLRLVNAPEGYWEREGVLRKFGIHPNASAEPRDVFCYSVVR